MAMLLPCRGACGRLDKAPLQHVDGVLQQSTLIKYLENLMALPLPLGCRPVSDPTTEVRQ